MQLGMVGPYHYVVVCFSRLKCGIVTFVMLRKSSKKYKIRDKKQYVISVLGILPSLLEARTRHPRLKLLVSYSAELSYFIVALIYRLLIYI
jgi:hypothetical protein